MHKFNGARDSRQKLRSYLQIPRSNPRQERNRLKDPSHIIFAPQIAIQILELFPGKKPTSVILDRHYASRGLKDANVSD